VSDATSELGAISAFLATLPLAGETVTFGAEFTQWLVAQQVVHQRGTYLIVVNANQPTLLRMCALVHALQHGPRPTSRDASAQVGAEGYVDHSAYAASGRRTTNVLPLHSSLSAEIAPPYSSTSSRALASRRQGPRNARARLSRDGTKSKRWGKSSCGVSTPSSRTMSWRISRFR
jgi:hypothetical protein